MEIPPPTGLITLLTDFGARDPYVGIMKGVIKQQHARAEVVDLCHEVPAQAVAVGALFLGAAVGRFPPGTVHVAVVDPGVGTARRVIAVCSESCYWVGPDNGLLGAVLPDERRPGEVRGVDLDALRLTPRSATFHGRDVFAPLGAMLAGRRYGYRALGARVDDAVRLATPPLVAVDHFGNLITDVTAAEVAARGAQGVAIAGRRVPLCRTYRDVEPGRALALINSYDLLEVAVCEGNAAAALAAGRGAAVELLEELAP
jgi:S-adenosylmethionine hydrolase